MKLNTIIGLGAAVAMSLVTNTALAACPGVFSGEACNGSTQDDICVKNAADDVYCNVVGTGPYDYATQGAYAYFVTPTNTTFRAYGWDGQGEKFCCEFDNLTDGCENNLIDIEIAGTDYDDTLTFDDVSAGNSLDCANGTIKAGDGDDAVTGSPNTTNQDHLYGQDGSDVIRGLAGNDNIYGDDVGTPTGYEGDDYLYGGDDDDFIRGHAGGDHIKGGGGADDISGGTGEDFICGGNGGDTIDGDSEDDEITGELGVDTINGGGHTDGDICEPEATATGCEDTTTFSLGETCPW
jgi:Ca2+-binding RTX toxin-like protein